ncbi:unnamed protein product [Urochloa decumbens]|uniref:DUF1618 domain-containing protein n=1 Tax=Urochloa decumbens TaxID=240449 RepID=A0ABC9FTI1_9POAL
MINPEGDRSNEGRRDPGRIMSPKVPSTHPSLCSPPHGYPPPDDNEDPPPSPSWVLLDLHAYIADRENATSAYAEMSNGKAIRATFCTPPLPLVSYICVWCPNLPPTDLAMEPTVEAADADLVLLRVSLRGYSSCHDYFVYRAPSGGKAPLLWRLHNPDPYMLYRHNIALLAHRDIGDDGHIRPHVDDDGHYYMAALNYDFNRPGNFMLFLYNSMDKKWTGSPVTLGIWRTHRTAKTITLGEGGLLGFVDPWRGILVCDILGRKREHYLPLPEHLIRLDKIDDEPLLVWDIAFVNGRLTLVELNRRTSYPDKVLNWDVTTWSISSPWQGQDAWQRDYSISTSSIIVDDDTANVDLCK